jgi:hypothetical protein
MAGSRRPGHVEHEKNTFFSLLKNTRSGGISQGREAPPQRAERSGEPLRMLERRVRRVPGFPREPHLLAWDGSARKRPDSPRPFVFNTFTHVDRDVYIKQPRPDDFYP